MSIDALSWAFSLDLPGPATKLTLLALANYANEDHESYPSQKTLSKRTCLSERAIRKHLVILEELGILVRTTRKRVNGTFTTDLFTLQVGAKPSSGIQNQRHAVPQAQIADGTPCHDQRHVVPQPAARGAGQESSLNTTVTKTEPENTGDLPHGISQEAWTGFLDMRNKQGKPPTDNAIKLLYRNLGKFKDEGQDVNAILEQSIVNGWTNVYRIKPDHLPSGSASRPQQVRPNGRFDPTAYVNRNARRERDVN